jgi:murein DD-endopeptidase MepM/ murein hydrolase activator NlpD
LRGTDPGVVVVDFPLRGTWRAVHTPAHRVPSHGTAMWAQSYAFDFLRFHPGTRRFHRRSTCRYLTTGVRPEDCDGYRSPVLAAFPGTIVRASDGLVDRDPVHLLRDLGLVLRNAVRPPGYPEPWAIVGNHVIVEHADIPDCFAMYAHLAHGSVAVAVGTLVDAGDLLGAVGHTGNSTAPHLHFQLMTTDDPTTAAAIPCAFSMYEFQRDGDWVRAHSDVPGKHTDIRSLDS